MSIFKNKCFNFVGKYNKGLNIEKTNEYINKKLETNLNLEKDIDNILEYYIEYYEEANDLYLKNDI